MQELGPVHAACLVARGADKGPTPYGRSDIEESFAESFALYKADPAALRRIYSEVYGWFAAGRHIAALQAAVPDELLPSDSLMETATATR